MRIRDIWHQDNARVARLQRDRRFEERKGLRGRGADGTDDGTRGVGSVASAVDGPAYNVRALYMRCVFTSPGVTVQDFVS